MSTTNGKPSNPVQMWMPFYIGDYLADTIGLTLAQHGAYCLAIIKYWRKGEALTQFELESTCQREFDCVASYFVFVDGRWHHKRIDHELQRAREKKNSLRYISTKGVAARRALGQIPHESYSTQ